MIYSIICLTDIWLQTHLGRFKASTQDGKLRSIEELLKSKEEKVSWILMERWKNVLSEVKFFLENWVGCARFLAFQWRFLVPTNMYYDRSLTSVTPCWSSTLPIFDLASFYIHLLGHCNIFATDRKLIITSRLAFSPMTKWSRVSDKKDNQLIAWRCSSSLPFCIVQPGFSWSKLVWSTTQERTWDVLLYTRHPTNTQYDLLTTPLPQWFW